jgi:hypothetical protein
VYLNQSLVILTIVIPAVAIRQLDAKQRPYRAMMETFVPWTVATLRLDAKILLLFATSQICVSALNVPLPVDVFTLQ